MSGIELARGETLALGSAGRKDEPPSLYSMLNVYRELMKGIARSPDFGSDPCLRFRSFIWQEPRAALLACYLPPQDYTSTPDMPFVMLGTATNPSGTGSPGLNPSGTFGDSSFTSLRWEYGKPSGN